MCRAVMEGRRLARRSAPAERGHRRGYVYHLPAMQTPGADHPVKPVSVITVADLVTVNHEQMTGRSDPPLVQPKEFDERVTVDLGYAKEPVVTVQHHPTVTPRKNTELARDLESFALHGTVKRDPDPVGFATTTNPAPPALRVIHRQGDVMLIEIDGQLYRATPFKL